MRIQSLSLENFRLAGEQPLRIDFSSEHNVTILLGDNGFGKTSVLDAISYTLSPYLSQFPFATSRNPSDFDLHVDDQGKICPYLSISAEFMSHDNQILKVTRTRKGMEAAPKSNVEDLRKLGQTMKDNIVDHEDVSLPVFAYYGTGRGQIKAPERKRGFQQSFERWDCYHNALLPSTDFKSFFAWYDLMEDEERRKREELRDFNFKLPALQAVRQALTNFVGDSYSNPRIEIHPLRFVMTELGEDGTHRDLRIEQLSDGYKIVIAMVADIASRMVEANPESQHPLESSGIILVDEIDLHLHPLWQLKIVSQLVKTFPNVQFVLTTHSPVIVAGAASISQIVKLNGRSQQNIENTNPELDTMDIGQILLSNYFGLPSLRSPKWYDKLNRRMELLSRSNLSASEAQELDKLNKELSVLQVGQTPNEIKASQLLNKIAQALNV